MDLAQIWRRLLHVVGRGRALLVDDAGAVQVLQVRLGADWVQDRLPRLAEYGFQSVPPAGSDAVLLFLGGNTSDGVVIATGSQTFRLKGLASGEVAISDNAGQKVYLSAAGIRIEGAGLPIEITTSAAMTLNAATLEVNADTTFTGTVHANGHAIDETHIHLGGTLTGGKTGVVTP